MRTLLIALCSALSLLAADPRVPIERYKLPNGMRVVLSPDNTTPVVTVYMIFDVGARMEQKGRSGFAHLFEHMMFQGSKNAPKGMHDKIVESNGGFLNGSTHGDYTDYFETLPSNKLALSLWLESDRMRGLDITAENLKNQQEAVKQERRMRVDNQPYALATVELWPALAFRNWGNSHSIIGSFEDLNAASVGDVSQFFKTFYAPNNAVLVMCGDIRIPEAKKLVDSYFADIPAQPSPKAPDLLEPPQTAPRWETTKDPQARVPAVFIGYPGPKRRSPDYYALMMIDLVLTGGDSSRFQLDLVKGKQSVIQFESNLGWPFGSFTDYKEPGVYGMNMLHNPNFNAKQIVGQVEEQIARLQKDLVPQAELDRIRTFFRSYRMNQLQSSNSRATQLGQYELLDGNPDFINTEMALYLAVTPEQIRDTARKVFVRQRQTVLEVVPAPEPAKKEEK